MGVFTQDQEVWIHPEGLRSTTSNDFFINLEYISSIYMRDLSFIFLNSLGEPFSGEHEEVGISFDL